MAKEVEKRSGKATRQRYKKDRREAVIQVRMNGEELALLDGKRGGRTRSNYLRSALYGSADSRTKHEVVADTPQLDRMLMELNRIGVNINQIARAYNTRSKGMSMMEQVRADMQVKSDKEAFANLRESIDRLSDEVKESPRRIAWRNQGRWCLMSTTYVQALPGVRGRMSYTEFGEGKRRCEHLQNGTDRIAAQMGDMPSRAKFIAYCNGLHSVHPNMVNEGYELRVSWALDELNPGNPDDVQRGMEHAYLLCHRLAPDSPCWVTMHVDGEGGCVHAHATIANHDCRTGQVINKDDTSLFAPRVQAVNDELSREWGLSVIGADKDKSTWAEKRDSFELRFLRPPSRRCGGKSKGRRQRY